MDESPSYEEILERKYVPGRDFRIAFGDSKVARCLLIAPHGGGIEPGTSEIMRAVVEPGSWAWYEFAGFLRQGNKQALHMASTNFKEPTLLGLLPQAAFVVAFHGASESGDPVVYTGGRWKFGRDAIAKSINAFFDEHGIRASDDAAGNLRGSEESNVTNRGKLQEGIQLEFSRGARDLLFPPDCSREARGRRSARLRSLARSIHLAVEELTHIAEKRLQA